MKQNREYISHVAPALFQDNLVSGTICVLALARLLRSVVGVAGCLTVVNDNEILRAGEYTRTWWPRIMHYVHLSIHMDRTHRIRFTFGDISGDYVVRIEGKRILSDGGPSSAPSTIREGQHAVADALESEEFGAIRNFCRDHPPHKLWKTPTDATILREIPHVFDDPEISWSIETPAPLALSALSASVKAEATCIA